MSETTAFFTILGRTKHLVLHGTGEVFIRDNDRYVGRCPDSLPSHHLHAKELAALRAAWDSQNRGKTS